jgi:hypothetical protein
MSSLPQNHAAGQTTPLDPDHASWLAAVDAGHYGDEAPAEGGYDIPGVSEADRREWAEMTGTPGDFAAWLDGEAARYRHSFAPAAWWLAAEVAALAALARRLSAADGVELTVRAAALDADRRGEDYRRGYEAAMRVYARV